VRFYFRSNLNRFLFADSDIKQLCYIVEFLRHNVSLNFDSVRNWYIQVEQSILWKFRLFFPIENKIIQQNKTEVSIRILSQDLLKV